MRFGILHLSDLHRDLSDEVSNEWLLDSLEKDFNQFEKQTPPIAKPSLSIVSGDLIYGVKPGTANGLIEQQRQYAQAEEFLIGMAERFFERKRERIVILPGNHDVSYEDVMASTLKIDSRFDPDRRSQLVSEFFKSNSRLRWSWRDMKQRWPLKNPRKNWVSFSSQNAQIESLVSNLTIDKSVPGVHHTTR